MHFIQKSILDALRTAETMHYAKLNSLGVESGHFRYHLTQLVKDGLVGQPQRGVYALSTAGRAFVDELSLGKIRPNKMPKVITYTLLQDGDKLLLQRKVKAPYRRLLNMIGGKVHLGETGEEASAREVYEKTGVVISNPHPRGTAEILIYEGDQLLTHVVALLFSAEVSLEQFVVSNVEVVDKATLTDIKEQLAPDFLEVCTHIFAPAEHGKSVVIKIII